MHAGQQAIDAVAHDDGELRELSGEGQVRRPSVGRFGSPAPSLGRKIVLLVFGASIGGILVGLLLLIPDSPVSHVDR